MVVSSLPLVLATFWVPMAPLFRLSVNKFAMEVLSTSHTPDIERYFMLIPEACKLVLQATTIGEGGKIYVFDMGQPVKIVD